MIRINQAMFAGSLLSTLFAAATAAAAGPSLESAACAVKMPAGATSGAYASEDCAQIFVTPPTAGKARVTAVAPKLNLNFCPAVLEVGDVAFITVDSMATVAKKIHQMIADFEPLNKEIDALNARWLEATRLRDIAQGTFDHAEATKTELTSAVASAKSSLDVCTILGSCTTEQAAYANAVTDLKKFLVATYLPAQQALVTAKANSDAAQAAFNRKTADLANALSPLFDLLDKLVTLNTMVNALYSQYVRLSGFTASMLYSTAWSKAISDFQAANPGKNVVRMPIKRPRLSAAAIGVGGYTTDTPSILGFAIPGVVGGKSIDLMAMPLGTESMPKLTTELDPSIQYDGVFGDSVSAQANVSLMGACKFYRQGLSGGVTGDINDLTAEVALNAFYTYDLAVRRGYEASYNLAKWAKRIETVRKRGGFFSSKALHDIVEDSNSSDWFSIRFNGNSGFAYTPEEQARITKEVKGQLQERALRTIALQMNALPGDTRPGLIPPQPRGAGLAAIYVMEGCGYWSWCTGGSYVLGVLDSIFGGSTAASSFQNSNNVWVNETVSGVAFSEQSGLMSYSK